MRQGSEQERERQYVGWVALLRRLIMERIEDGSVWEKPKPQSSGNRPKQIAPGSEGETEGEG